MHIFSKMTVKVVDPHPNVFRNVIKQNDAALQSYKINQYISIKAVLRSV